MVLRDDQLRGFEVGETSANDPQPGKRSISYSSPTIVTDTAGRPALGIGSPGGSRIPIVLNPGLRSFGRAQSFHESETESSRMTTCGRSS